MHKCYFHSFVNFKTIFYANECIYNVIYKLLNVKKSNKNKLKQHTSHLKILCVSSTPGQIGKWNVFVEGRKLENLEKNNQSKMRTNNKLNPHVEVGQNENWTTLVGGECYHHCAISTPQCSHLYGGSGAIPQSVWWGCAA